MARGYTLYGAEVSYFTGKVRAYLRYKRIPFAEVLNTPDVYRQIILPRVGWPVIPVVTTPEDEIWQDSTEIIDALESRFPDPSIYPATVRQHLVSLLLEVYGDEWLKLPAMHYRWNHNRDFAVNEFGRMSLPGATPEEQRAAGEKISKPFAGALPFLGVTPETAPAIENSYEALLGELDAHFAKHEFLLGTRPSIGDFGLFGPLYAHQYRDPASGDLMKARAPNLVRWVERMRVPSNPKGGEFLLRDEVPETLMPVLSRMMREMIPELVSVAHHLGHWQKGDGDGQPKLSGTEVPRALGQHEFKLGSVTGKRAIFPFELWMLQRPLDYIASLEEDDKLRVADVLRQSGGETLMDFPAFPRLVRRNFKLALA
jgi:glutathione S-transferase